MWFILAIVSLAAVTTGFQGLLGQESIPVDLVTTSACYSLDETKKITIDPNWLIQDDCKNLIGGRNYVGIRPNLKIVNAKIREGEGAHPNNDCSESFYGSLRKVGTLASGEDIFWESENYQHGDLRDFILVNIDKDEKYHYFDVYIDETKKNDLPDFVVNCEEKGGIIPVLEGPNASVFPPQFVSREAINHSNPAHDANFNDPNINPFLKEYFVRIEETDLPQPTPGQPSPQIGIFEKTVGSETHIYDVFFHAGILYLKDQDDGKTYMYNPSDDAPDYPKKRNPSLQLKAQKFISTALWTWATPECKPALYLYPEKPTELSVKVMPRGKLTFSIPKHGSEGWRVVAHPDGEIQLTTDNLQLTTYPYLYYESAITDFSPPTKGWVVETNKLASLFDRILPKLGLNKAEKEEFKRYWLVSLNQQPYYFAGLVPQEEIDRVEPIEFSVDPDTFIRVRLYFEPLTAPMSVEEPILPEVSSREGFTAVDWGGFLAKGSCLSDETITAISN